MNVLLLLPLITCAPVADASDPARRPYQLDVCIRAADNPILTPLFIESVRQQVRDQMTNYFGALAEVEVRSSEHWLLEPYARQEIDRPAITPQMLAEHGATGKIVLLGIDHRDGYYHLSWRQLDGTIQQVGPVRSRSTPDRQWVARAFCLAIKDTFAATATVEPGEFSSTAVLRFCGHEHRSRLEDLLGQRCVLQLFWVLRGRDALHRRAIPDTFLRLDPKESIRRAKVVTNLSNPFPQRAVIAGYEAIKINTRTGRLRLKLVDAEFGLPAVDCSVSASDRGFDDMAETDILPDPDKEGFVLSPRDRPFEHMAFVRVSHADSVIKVPIPITDEVTEYVIKLHTQKDASEKEDFRRKVRFLIQDTQSILAMQADTAREFNDLNKSKRYEEALNRVQATLEFVRPRLDETLKSLTGLQQQARQLDNADSPLLQAAAQQVAQGQDNQKEQRQLKDSLDSAIKKQDAQARADVIMQLGKQAERVGDIEEALLRYELALNEQEDQSELRTKVERLKQAWAPKDREHEDAHATIYDRWANAVITDVESLLPEVRQAFEVLKRHGDDLRARRLSAINSEQLSHLNALVDQLAQRGTEEDKDELEKYVALTESLANLQGEVARFIEDAVRGTSTPQTGPASPPDTSAAKPPLTLDEEEEEEEEPLP